MNAALPGPVVRYLLTAAIALLASLAGAEPPKPQIVIANPGQCVAPADVMRRTHMDLLKHQRDRTLRQGERGAKISLNACVECHASKASGSVLGGKEAFCETCHSYAAVKLDCFECHQAKVPKMAARR